MKIKVREKPDVYVYIFVVVHVYISCMYILIPGPSSGNVYHFREVPCEYLNINIYIYVVKIYTIKIDLVIYSICN